MGDDVNVDTHKDAEEPPTTLPKKLDDDSAAHMRAVEHPAARPRKRQKGRGKASEADEEEEEPHAEVEPERKSGSPPKPTASRIRGSSRGRRRGSSVRRGRGGALVDDENLAPNPPLEEHARESPKTSAKHLPILPIAASSVCQRAVKSPRRPLENASGSAKLPDYIDTIYPPIDTNAHAPVSDARIVDREPGLPSDSAAHLGAAPLPLPLRSYKVADPLCAPAAPQSHPHRMAWTRMCHWCQMNSLPRPPFARPIPTDPRLLRPAPQCVRFDKMQEMNLRNLLMHGQSSAIKPRYDMLLNVSEPTILTR
ncbi:hypothetical protein AURDEDRAFT_163573 [Auricularia subglabra TFB-10046 SS5]|nr:hypothetical protein AURDEDRAFT_163573 [Auricularia subglabra TFB-10046 SS5]